MNNIAAKFYEIGEPYAAGLFEEPEKDYFGNEIRPSSDESRETITNYLYDYSYYYAEPLSIVRKTRVEPLFS